MFWIEKLKCQKCYDKPTVKIYADEYDLNMCLCERHLEEFKKEKKRNHEGVKDLKT